MIFNTRYFEGGENLSARLMLAQADWLIDLGPEGGEKGGSVLCTGTPETVVACAASYTGKYLKETLGQR